MAETSIMTDYEKVKHMMVRLGIEVVEQIDMQRNEICLTLMQGTRKVEGHFDLQTRFVFKITDNSTPKYTPGVFDRVELLDMDHARAIETIGQKDKQEEEGTPV